MNIALARTSIALLGRTITPLNIWYPAREKSSSSASLTAASLALRSTSGRGAGMVAMYLCLQDLANLFVIPPWANQGQQSPKYDTAKVTFSACMR